MRCFTRALKRSGLNVWYTQGFNTHIYLMFASPLSLGFESDYETMDFRIDDDIPVPFDDIVERINSGLPNGIRVFSAAVPAHPHTDVAFSEWDIHVYGNGDALYESFSGFISQHDIPITRKTKKGKEKTENAVEYIRKISFEKEDTGLHVNAVLKSDTSSSLNPSLLVSTYLESCGQGECDTKITRKKLLLSSLELFV